MDPRGFPKLGVLAGENPIDVKNPKSKGGPADGIPK
jgi:hypothetical protein